MNKATEQVMAQCAIVAVSEQRPIRRTVANAHYEFRPLLVNPELLTGDHVIAYQVEVREIPEDGDTRPSAHVTKTFVLSVS